MSANYCLLGVGPALEIGKGNGKLVADGQDIAVFENDGVTRAQLKVALVPVDDEDAASKSYVTSLINGLTWKDPVRACTTGALPANTYAGGAETLTGNANGALPAQDGVSLAVSDRLLVKDEGSGVNNGIYVVTDLGSAGTPYVLTRAADMAAGSTATNATVFCSEGTAGADSVHTQTAQGDVATVVQAWVLIASTTAGINTIADFAAGDQTLIASGVGPSATLYSFSNTTTITVALVGSNLEASVNALSINTAQLADGAVSTAKLADGAIAGGVKFAAVTAIEIRCATVAYTDGTVTLKGPGGVVTLPANKQYLHMGTKVVVTTTFDDAAATLVVRGQNPALDGGTPFTLQAATEIDLAAVGTYDCGDSQNFADVGAPAYTYDAVVTPGTSTQGSAIVCAFYIALT